MKSTLLPILEPSAAPAATPHGLPLLRLGFRPFYLGATAFAALAMALWIAMLLGRVTVTPAVPALLWHAHEMLFGFAVAVIVGFLLTAGKAWTGLPTPRGVFLGVLAALWLAARVAAVAAPYAVYAALDLALLPIVAIVFIDLLVRARNRRNLPLGAMLLTLAFVNLLFHLSVAGRIDVPPPNTLYAALGLIIMIECVVAGRVVPSFTANATPGLRLQAQPKWEAATLVVTAFALASWVFALPSPLTALCFGVASALHARRLWQWQPRVTLGRPILWVLHAAYAWMPIGFALLALAHAGLLPVSAGVHALAVGATGGLIIGMVTRTARGHTGRQLQASRPEVTAYALVLGAALLRVLASLLPPSWVVPTLVAAACAWIVAFVLYLVVFAPWLMQPRVDGKDG